MLKLFGKNVSRFLSIVLTFAFIAALLLTGALAVNETSGPELLTMSDELSEKPSLTGADVVGEDKSLRSEDTKHFRLTDGSKLAVQYGAPVHYEAPNGQWADIDNSLQLRAADGTILKQDISSKDNILNVILEKLDIMDAREADTEGSQATSEEDSLSTPGETSESVDAQQESDGSEDGATGSEADDPEAESPSALEETTFETIPSDAIMIADRLISATDKERLAEIKLSVTNSGSLDTEFAPVSGISQEVSIGIEKYRVGFSMLNANTAVAAVLDNDIVGDGSLASAIALPDLESTVEYSNVQNGIDLIYTAANNSVK